jgi:hypothetical protein
LAQKPGSGRFGGIELPMSPGRPFACLFAWPSSGKGCRNCTEIGKKVSEISALWTTGSLFLLIRWPRPELCSQRFLPNSRRTV